jgi:hypothetical protein
MKSICNKTQRPLSVPLPQGKTLHLGPGKTGQVSKKAIEHPPLLKLVEAGELEIIGEGQRPADASSGTKPARPNTPDRTPGSGVPRSGDR